MLRSVGIPNGLQILPRRPFARSGDALTAHKKGGCGDADGTHRCQESKTVKGRVHGTLFGLENGYFSGAISNFFFMPLLSRCPSLLEQQAKVSTPQEVHLWFATSYFALPCPSVAILVWQPGHR